MTRTPVHAATAINAAVPVIVTLDHGFSYVPEEELQIHTLGQSARHAPDASGQTRRLSRFCAARLEDTRDWRAAKTNRSAQIEAVVALAMAVERAEVKPEPVRL